MKTAKPKNILYVSLFIFFTSCSLWGPVRKDESADDYQIKKSISGWVSKPKWEEADYLFVHEGSSAHITVSSLCDRYELSSLESLSKSLLSPLSNQVEIETKKQMIDSRAALTKRVKAKLDGVDVESIATVLRKGDCIFDFFLTSFKEISEVEEKAYEELLKSFHYKGY